VGVPVPVEARLLELLRCPACRGTVQAQPEDRGLLCASCGRLYPIVDGIPVMLVDEARAPGTTP